MARGRKGGQAKNSIKMAVYGKYGTRKSNFLVDFAKMKNEDGRPLRVLYIDPENGSIDGYAIDRLIEEGVDVDNIFILYTSSYKEIEQYCDRAIKNGKFYEIEEVYDEELDETEWIEQFGDEDKLIRDADGNPFVADAIVIDGITVVADNINEAAINLSEVRAEIRADAKGKTSKEKEVMVGTAGLEFKDYTKIKSKGRRLIHRLIKSSDKHVGISLRSKDQKVMKKDNKGNMVLTATGKEVVESWDFILFDVYTVIHTFTDIDGENYAIVENKDRTGMFEPFTRLDAEEMSVSKWQPIIDKNKNRKRSVANKSVSYENIVKQSETAYKEMVGEQPQSKSESNPDVKKEDNPEKLKKIVQECIGARNELPPKRKGELKSVLKKEGLPINWDENCSIQEMEKVLEILKK